ncbi:Mannose-6-phosphate isomerase [Sodalis praecaptivus]|uniref:Pyrimidine/purine nucleoside phosphorylase n=1 Tax=Sodalis praecaptivus TaxID=1239307 RepID=W0I0U1_9GAMM|nr:pyrimidine/purine nucleoside phosphorylase [Sodalis praecaptivus]AHF78053.1 Mannose-6-phosphate isomerase [Sodalis praecaptivus]CAJ0991473.1 Pyrimidine/purine nucleoside phosphorylase [Sodalis praecaptivus]
MLKVNDYFAGKVKSIGFDAASTGRASVGVMEAGEYTFTTGQPEEMTVVSGALKTLLPGANDWQVFMPGESFYVPAHSEFCLQLAETSSYLCRYLSHSR